MAEWGRTTLEMIVDELRQPVQLDESFERRVMVRVRRLYAERRPRRGRGWLTVAATIANPRIHAGVFMCSIDRGVLA